MHDDADESVEENGRSISPARLVEEGLVSVVKEKIIELMMHAVAACSPRGSISWISHIVAHHNKNAS
jgi:hypothetical protein